MIFRKKIFSVLIGTAAMFFVSSTAFGNVVIDNSCYYTTYGYQVKISRSSSNKPLTTVSTTKPTSSNNKITLVTKKTNTNDNYNVYYNNNNYPSNYYLIPKSNNNTQNKVVINNNQNNKVEATVNNTNNSTTKKETDSTINNNIKTNDDISQSEMQLFNMVNNERTKNGLKPLKLNNTLFKIAEIKSQDMYDNNYFSHTSPTFGKTYSLFDNYGIKYTAAAENIGKTYSVGRAHSGFMNSKGHRANILNPKYTEVGIGIVGNYYTEVFIK